MMFVLIGIGLMVLGGALAMLVAGVRGRKISDHPRCVKCSFDLHGVYPGVEACPECGTDVTRNEAVARGIRQRCPGLIAGGSVVLLLALALGSAGLAAGLTGFDWNTIKPVWWLVRDAESANPIASAEAIAELADRIEADELHDTALRKVLDAALDHQGDTSQPWQPMWGRVFVLATSNGLFTAEEKGRFLTNVFLPVVDAREKLRVGDPLPITLRQYVRGRPGDPGYGLGVPFGGRGPEVAVRLKELGGVLDGETPIDLGGGMSMVVQLFESAWQDPLGSTTSSYGFQIRPHTIDEHGYRRVELGPGEHTLVLYYGLRTAIGNDIEAIAEFPDGWASDRVWEDVEEGVVDGVMTAVHPIELTFEVVEDPADAYRPIDDPTLATSVLESFALPEIELILRDESANLRVGLRLERTPPAELAFDVYLRDGDRWWGVHSYTRGKLDGPRIGRRPSTSVSRYERVPVEGNPDVNVTPLPLNNHSLYDLDAEYVDVVLVPSEAAAIESIDVHEPWWGEIVIEHVPVSIIDERTP
jgi:hypothetical protein